MGRERGEAAQVAEQHDHLEALAVEQAVVAGLVHPARRPAPRPPASAGRCAPTVPARWPARPAIWLNRAASRSELVPGRDLDAVVELPGADAPGRRPPGAGSARSCGWPASRRARPRTRRRRAAGRPCATGRRGSARPPPRPAHGPAPSSRRPAPAPAPPRPGAPPHPRRSRPPRPAPGWRRAGPRAAVRPDRRHRAAPG